MKIVIAPFAAVLPSGIRNAKNFPYWSELVDMLRNEGYEVIQIGRSGEPFVENVSRVVFDASLDQLEELLKTCAVWISVDSWLPHFCATMRLPTGIVIWAQSNPKIWGYSHNINLLKDVKYLRQFQYAPWYDVPYIEDAFVSPEVVMEALHGKLAQTVGA